MILLLEHCGIIAGIVHYGLGIPLATAFHAGQRALKGVFCLHLMSVGILQIIVLYGAFHILTDVQVSGTGILAPPPYEGFIIGGRMSYLPIYLGNVVIHPTLAHPFKYVGIQVVIVLQTIGFGTVGIVLLVTEYAERTYTELTPRLYTLYRFVKLLDELVDVIAPPIITRHAVAVLLV